MRLIQRDAGTGTIPFVGDAARLLAGDAVIVDWTPRQALTNVPQGCYTLEVSRDGQVSAEPVGIGIIVAALGQSNIQRWFRNPTCVEAAESTFQFKAGHWVGVDGPGGRTFTARMARGLGIPVGIINAAVGGAPLTPEAEKGRGHWLDASPGSFYAIALDRMREVGGRAEFVLWMQGETDAGLRVPPERYREALIQLFLRIKRDFGNPTILIGEIGAHADASGRPDGLYDAVREVQGEVAGMLEDVHIAARTLDLPMADRVHLSPASFATAAERMAETALALLGAESMPGERKTEIHSNADNPSPGCRPQNAAPYW